MVTDVKLIMRCNIGDSLALPCGMVVVNAMNIIFLVMVLCITNQMDDRHNGTLGHSLNLAELYTVSKDGLLVSAGDAGGQS